MHGPGAYPTADTRTGFDAERHCCRFLDFAISAEGDRGSVVLEITGPSGTADFLESWIRPAP